MNRSPKTHITAGLRGSGRRSNGRRSKGEGASSCFAPFRCQSYSGAASVSGPIHSTALATFGSAFDPLRHWGLASAINSFCRVCIGCSNLIQLQTKIMELHLFAMFTRLSTFAAQILLCSTQALQADCSASIALDVPHQKPFNWLDCFTDAVLQGLRVVISTSVCSRGSAREDFCSRSTRASCSFLLCDAGNLVSLATLTTLSALWFSAWARSLSAFFSLAPAGIHRWMALHEERQVRLAHP